MLASKECEHFMPKFLCRVCSAEDFPPLSAPRVRIVKVEPEPPRDADFSAVKTKITRYISKIL